MKIGPKSHLDHGITDAHIRHILDRFANRSGFFAETLIMPRSLASLPCAMHGPIVGEKPVGEDEAFYERRNGRKGLSRMCARRPSQSRKLTVIAGPSGNDLCVLYTAYGGPLAPREPWDPSMSESERRESVAFWSKHALSK